MPESIEPIRDYEKVSAAVCAIIWQIDEPHLTSIVEVLTLRSAGMRFTQKELQARISVKACASQLSFGTESKSDKPYQVVGSVAVIPVHGVLTPRASWMTEVSAMTSTQQLADWIREAVADKDVSSIILDVDSPGGDAKGNAEVAQVIREARSLKPIKAVVTGLGASAAYYIASAASEVIVSPSSEVGSIGTFSVHREDSQANAARGVTYSVIKAGENKAAGNSYEPLTDKTRAVLQERVDALNQQFVEDVAKNRGVSTDVVNTQFGQGKVLLAQAAVAAGLADRVATLDQVLAELTQRPSGGPSQPTPSPQLKAKEETSMADTATPTAAPVASEAKTSEATTVAAGTSQKSTTPSAADIRAAERERIAELNARGEVLGISPEAIQAAIDNDTSVEAAVNAWTKDLAKDRSPIKTAAKVTHASEDKFFAASEEALLHRLNAQAVRGKTISAEARDLRYVTMLQMAERSLQLQNIRTQGLPPDEIAAMALGQSAGDMFIRAGDFTARTTDFPNIMAAVANKMLMQTAEEAGFTFREWSSELSPVADFNPRSLLQTGQFPEFDQLSEGQNFDRVTTDEQAAWIAADQFGQEWAMTAKMIQNNSLDAFSDAVVGNQQAHDATLNRLHINLLLGSGAICWDGKALWHADHANSVASGQGGAPSLEQLQKMRELMRSQKGIGKGASRRLSYTMNLILAGMKNETPLDQVLGTTKIAQLATPTTDANVNVFRGKLDYAIDAMIDDEATSAAWYGFTKNPTAKPIVHVFMQGYERMKVRTYYDPKNNSRVWQFEGRFACAVRDWKGLVRNPGS